MAIYTGTPGPDGLYGGKSNDQFTGGAGNDTINGDQGNDTAIYEDPFASYSISFDHVFGGYVISSPTLGTDLVLNVEQFEFAGVVYSASAIYTGMGVGTAGYDRLVGTPNPDVLEGLDGGDTLSGLAGDDTLYGDAWADSLLGGADNDHLYGGGDHDYLNGGAGNDMLDGGSGIDAATFDNAGGPVVVNLVTQTATGDGDDTLVSIERAGGGPFDDMLIGNAQDNTIWDGTGNGNDTLIGGDGNDELSPSGGDDLIDGGAGKHDNLNYGFPAASLVIDLTAGRATGMGDDTLIGIEDVSGSPYDDTLLGDAQDNRLYSHDGNDELRGFGGIDDLQGGVGTDWMEGGAGDDFLSGDSGGGWSGVNVAAYSGKRADYTFTAKSADEYVIQDSTPGRDGKDTVRFIDFFEFADGVWTMAGMATPTNTSIEGDASANTLSGTVGADLMAGLNGADTIHAGGGDDTILGGFGDDVLDGGAGADMFIGGPGLDMVTYADWGTPVHVDMSTSVVFDGFDEDTLSGVEGVTGSAMDDTMTGFYAGEIFQGGDGSDALAGFGGSDTLLGGSGNDTLSGGEGNDTIDAGAGIDTAAFTGTRSEYVVTLGPAVQVTDLVMDRDSADALSGVERLRFSDQGLALDLDAGAGMVAKLLGAVFGAAAVHNQGFAGIGLQYADGGMAMEQLATLALSVQGTYAHTDVVNLLWMNVMGALDDAGLKQELVAGLDAGLLTVGALTAMAATTAQNLQNIGFAELTESGLGFI